MEQREHNLNQEGVTSTATAPEPALAFGDAIAIIVGIVIGAGIFETPALVAANSGNGIVALGAWVLGGLISLLGALCYGELATTYPHTGGNYYYLLRAFGKPVAFLFAWARMTVIQTGSIALLAFVFGDYASQLFRLGTYSPSIYAGLAIALLTGLNIVGVQQGKVAQNWLTAAKVLGLLLVVGVGLAATIESPQPSTISTESSLGLVMIFVLLSYGGWNEAAYISAEIRNVRRNMVRSLVWSLGIITAIYLLINLAYLRGLGLAGTAGSQAVAADLMRGAFGTPGAVFISFLIAISTLGATNATIFTGARTNYALGQDFAGFTFLGRWQRGGNTPAGALLVQGAISLVLVVFGTLAPRNGFETMVDYTAPVFWFFFLLSVTTIFVLRQREPQVRRPFQVPFYPVTPLIFCIICIYLLYSSVTYTGIGALLGLVVVISGIPLLFWTRKQQT
ncbi:amino acid/polyamine/organocation transporter, APC superfamily [Gloeocapsa sp. PCC 7428]|uniref:APC family permease n=1 Tax=Gloeocapsa sp. PCC 7428 TaxID=1173026 RepID=UPI0002A5F127|nr:amino acid permease [Gloeocapsa sp. PCC 7428]AFZ32268.1 amino acid/polyamine/organocation transporter, APC superfamily [Gloeocapsa sp. PCC 7428]